MGEKLQFHRFFLPKKIDFDWNDLQLLEQSCGQLRVPSLSETILRLIFCRSGYFTAVDRQLVAKKAIQETKCRCFLLPPRYWHKKRPNGPYITHQSGPW